VSIERGRVAGSPLIDDMRQAADIIERLNRLHGYRDPQTGEWSPKQLRAEAAYLEKPIA
jgi:hypothetical protein